MDTAAVNSKQYWQQRFSTGDWEKNRGAEQTEYFYNLMLYMLPQRIKEDICSHRYAVVDFGCAEGQGTKTLERALNCPIKGVDFSESALEKAKSFFPELLFEIGDIWEYADKTQVAILSNIIEHFDEPFALVRRVAKFTEKYIIIMVPLEEKELMSEHKYTFLYNNIPVSIEGFQLVHFSEHNSAEDSRHLFDAKQILLVYSADSAMNESVSIEALCSISKLNERKIEERERLSALLNALDTRLDKLRGELEGGLAESVCRLSNRFDESLSGIGSDIAELGSALDRLALGIENIETAAEREKFGNRLCDMIKRELAAAEERRRLSERELVNLFKRQQAATLKAAAKAERDQAKNTRETLEILFARNDELCRENARLTELFNVTDKKYIELVERFNRLNDAYYVASAENVDIKGSRTYRIAVLQKKLAYKLHLIEPMKFALSVRRFGLAEALRQKKAKKQLDSEIKPTAVQSYTNNDTEETADSAAMRELEERKSAYADFIAQEKDDTTKRLDNIISEREHIGIIVYPDAVGWEPIQRPQQLLREFADMGYLCFFCDDTMKEEQLSEKQHNLFVVDGERRLTAVLQDKTPIVLMTWYLQSAFADSLPQKLIWFDILDEPTFLGYGNLESVKRLYPEIVAAADIVSYSAKRLKRICGSRNDALLLPNGVRISDFEGEKETVPLLEKLKSAGRKIVGYYGAIESWFDVEAIEQILSRSDYEVVLIGRIGIESEIPESDRLHIIGALPYEQLKNYAWYFDVALIPFVINDVTNSVSPVKFFEYAAQGIPVVSSDIIEMRQYEGEAVAIYHDYDELLAHIERLIGQKQSLAPRLCAIAAENCWEKRAGAIADILCGKIDFLKALADFENNGGVSVLSVTFFKYDGTDYYSGGAERYLLDLAEICREIGINYRIYQYSEYNWVRFYGNVEVRGLAAKKNDVNIYTTALAAEMCDSFRQESAESELNIYSPFYILAGRDKKRSVGISHGISWDNEYNHFTDGVTFWQANRNIIESAVICDKMVSVDTNTCNWFQTLDYDVGRKISYLPNYVDNTEFSPRASSLEPKDKVVILYPRRLYAPRGLYVVLDIVDELLERYPNAELHFVGKGFENDTKNVEKKIKLWGDRIKWYSKAPEEMNVVYKSADITLIPTMYSEGTSLSCLEAMSSGNAVIATRIGGLTDLVINGFNGILTEPDSKSLKNALFSLLDNPEKMRYLKQNAVESAKAFSKKEWSRRWKSVIEENLPEGYSKGTALAKRCLIRLKNSGEIDNPAVISKIGEYLKKGWYVFVSGGSRELKYKSHKRLQFIDDERQLYFSPEVTIYSEEL